ncbi:membrane progestin receptor gamma-like [Mytilus californianus]|uniref:membrane progestin receptor gamma-like n=1 Tax=Mytilus californianus TaxID=6549 RepID=UPI0022476722|nr:membrane progestin receptor gamma-like [Mytilus californianus]
MEKTRQLLMNFLVYPLQSQSTVSYSEVPARFYEPGILHGYRLTNHNISYYLKSIFNVHNETGNIWTHLIGFVLVAYVLAQYGTIFEFWKERHSCPILIYGITALVLNALSTNAHIFHSMSLSVHDIVYLLDYCGISFMGFGSGVLVLCMFTDDPTYRTVNSFYFALLWISSFVLFAILCFLRLTPGMNKKIRKYLTVATCGTHLTLIAILIAPRYYHCYMDSECSIWSLNNISLMFLLSALQGFALGSHLPEVIFPGWFDILGHSHQWLHIFSVWQEMTVLKVGYTELIRGSTRDRNFPTISFLLSTTFLLLFMKLCFLFYMVRKHLKSRKHRH